MYFFIIEEDISVAARQEHLAKDGTTEGIIVALQEPESGSKNAHVCDNECDEVKDENLDSSASPFQYISNNYLNIII